MAALYNKFQAWVKENNKTADSEEMQQFEEFGKTVYQLDENSSKGIVSLVSTFVAPTIEIGGASDLLNSITCSTSPSRRKRDTETEAARGCPSKEYVAFKGHCFKYSSSKANWEEASVACRAEGAHLSQLGIDNLNLLLRLYKMPTNSDIHLGGKKNKEKASSWWWEDLRPVEAGFKWAPGQPDGMYEPADCMLWHQATIHDNFCKSELPYICQANSTIPLSPVDIPEDILNLMKPCKKIDVKDKNSALPPVDIYMNPEKKGIKDDKIKENEKIAHDYYTKERMEKVFNHLFLLFWNSRLPCFDQPDLSSASLIRSCEVAGERVNCSALFTKVPTDTGLCCALNSEFTLKKGLQFSELVRDMQNEDLLVAAQVKEKLNITNGVGKNKGVRLQLDLHSNFGSLGSVSDFFRAFQVFVGQPAEYPVLHQRSLMVKPGHETNLDLTATVLTASPDIVSISPKDRNCYFADEGEKAGLELYETYSYNSCVFECHIMYLPKKLKDPHKYNYSVGSLQRRPAAFPGTFPAWRSTTCAARLRTRTFPFYSKQWKPKLSASTACRTAAARSLPSASPRRSSGGWPGWWSLYPALQVLRLPQPQHHPAVRPDGHGRDPPLGPRRDGGVRAGGRLQQPRLHQQPGGSDPEAVPRPGHQTGRDSQEERR